MFLRFEAMVDRNEGMLLLFEAICLDSREFRQRKNPDLPGSLSGNSLITDPMTGAHRISLHQTIPIYFTALSQASAMSELPAIDG
jgi:hypothetical protein